MEGERTARADDERLIFTDIPHDAAALPVPIAAAWPAETVDDIGARDRRQLDRVAVLWRARVFTALETERERGVGFVLVPGFMAAGAAIYFCLPAEPGFGSILVSLALAAAAAFGLRGAPLAQAAALAALLLIVGAMAGKLETWRYSTPMSGSAISTRVTGRLVALEDRADGRTRLTIDLLSTERPQLRHAPDRFRATARDAPEGLGPGDGVTGVVRLLPASGPQRPYGYDFAFESYFDGLGANGFFLSGPFKAEVEAPAGYAASLSARVERWRMAIADRIRTHIAGAEGEVAAALVAGVRAGIPEDVTEALRTTGLAHFISISGLHMALVAGTVIGAMRAVFALFPGFASRHPVKKYAAGGGLVALVAYLALSGAEVAAQRSFIMFAVMLIAVLFDRAALTMRNLAIAAIIILAFAPHEVMGPSFQMSFAATAALIGAYGWYSERRRQRPAEGWARQRSPAMGALRLVALFFGGLAMTSLIAGLATGLFAVWHFQRMAPLGLVANLAAMPIVTVGVMPMAVMGVLAMPFGLDGPFFALMGRALAVVIAIAQFLAERSPFDAVGAIPPAAVCILSVALLMMTVATTWLRLAAVPLVAAGLGLIAMREQPDVLIAEDARMVAVQLSDGTLAVNRSRPSEFTLGIWEAALQAGDTVGPERMDGEALVPSGEAPFRCSGELCLARHASGAVVAFAETPAAAEQACAWATLLVIDDATAGGVCAGPTPVVITKQDLAWRGSAAVRFGATGPEIRYAIGEVLRPWHDYRRWSREARGLPPYRRSRVN